jgi:hypothetical protein
LAKKAASLPPFAQALLSAPTPEALVLELDELWSFVFDKAKGKRWVWLALTRHSR